MNVYHTLLDDYYFTGTMRCLVTNNWDEFSIQRIDPNSTIEVYEEF